jgi:hypothetical protein
MINFIGITNENLPTYHLYLLVLIKMKIVLAANYNYIIILLNFWNIKYTVNNILNNTS